MSDVQIAISTWKRYHDPFVRADWVESLTVRSESVGIKRVKIRRSAESDSRISSNSSAQQEFGQELSKEFGKRKSKDEV